MRSKDREVVASPVKGQEVEVVVRMQKVVHAKEVAAGVELGLRKVWLVDPPVLMKEKLLSQKQGVEVIAWTEWLHGMSGSHQGLQLAAGLEVGLQLQKEGRVIAKV